MRRPSKEGKRVQMSQAVNPYDGFRVEQKEIGDRLKLNLTLRADGVRLVDEFIYDNPTDLEGQGRSIKMCNALQAVCRYMNAGGYVDELRKVLDNWALRTNSLDLPDDWVVFDQDITVMSPQTTFANTKTGKMLVVEEDCYAEEFDGVDLLNELRRKNEETTLVQPVPSDEAQVEVRKLSSDCAVRGDNSDGR